MNTTAKIDLELSLAIAIGWAIYAVQGSHGSSEDYAGWTCEQLAQFSRDDGTGFLIACETSYQKLCATNRECGPFPCVDGMCLVMPCEADGNCPNGLCGLNATPVRGFCTTIDVQ